MDRWMSDGEDGRRAAAELWTEVKGRCGRPLQRRYPGIEIDDVLQETFLECDRIVQSGGFKPRGAASFTMWALKILERRAEDARRRESAMIQKRAQSVFSAGAVRPPTADQLAFGMDLRATISRCNEFLHSSGSRQTDSRRATASRDRAIIEAWLNSGLGGGPTGVAVIASYGRRQAHGCE